MRISCDRRSMMFDAARYDREVLRPLRGAHSQLPQSELMTRYWVEPGMTAEQLGLHLAEIRAWWRERAEAPDSRAQVCRLLIDADDRLAATAGDAMNDPAWWQEQTGTTRTAMRSAEATPDPVAESHPAAAAAPAAGQTRDWRSHARIRFWSGLATLDRERPGPPRPARCDPGPAPQDPAVAAPDLVLIHVAAAGAVGDRYQVEVSWEAAFAESVHVRWAPNPPPFGTGDQLSLSAMESWGRPLTGELASRGDRRVLSGAMPTGYLIYVPFLVSGDRAAAGKAVTVNVAGPVQRLTIERRGSAALVSWNWPSESSTAIVDWVSGDTVEHREITLAEYAAEHGCTFEPARAGGTVTVRAICVVGHDVALSPPCVACLSPAPVRLRYSMSKNRRLGRRAELIIGVIADQDCVDLSLDVVLGVERIMPNTVEHGEVRARLGPFSLRAEVETLLRTDWPEPSRRADPYWIRCFFRAPYPFSPQDPPVPRMRIT